MSDPSRRMVGSRPLPSRRGVTAPEVSSVEPDGERRPCVLYGIAGGGRLGAARVSGAERLGTGGGGPLPSFPVSVLADDLPSVALAVDNDAGGRPEMAGFVLSKTAPRRLEDDGTPLTDAGCFWAVAVEAGRSRAGTGSVWSTASRAVTGAFGATERLLTTDDTEGDLVRAATAAGTNGDDFAGSEVRGLTVPTFLAVCLSTLVFWALMAAARLRTELTPALRVAVVVPGTGRAGGTACRVEV